MRHQELDLDEAQQEIKKISRQVQVLADTCRRSKGDTFETLNQKRKLRGALDYSLQYLKKATKIATVTAQEKQANTPLLTRQSLSQVIRSGKKLEEVAAYFGMDKKSILNTMRIFGITFPKKVKVGES